MNDDRKLVLARKKGTAERRAKKSRNTAIQRPYFAKNIEHFSQKYRYADESEAFKIEEFISKLNFIRPGQLAIKKVCTHSYENVYLCFLMGTEALFQIYIFGKYDDIMSDYDEWEVFSPYLLLVDEDFIHYVYVNDYGETMESKIEMYL